MTIGEKIKATRKEKGYSQQELAIRCGYKHKSAISNHEKKDTMNISTLTVIASALDVSVQYLLNGVDNMEDVSIELENTDERLKKLMAIYSKLSEQGKDSLLRVAEEISTVDKITVNETEA